MGIQIHWDNPEKTIIRYDFDVRWTWEEFFAAKREANREIDAVQQKVGVILNAPPNMKLPPNMLTNGRNGLHTKHPNTIVLVFVVNNAFIRTMIRTLKGLSLLAASTVEQAASVDEARHLIRERLATLDNTTIPER